MTQFIAEICSNHNGSLDRALALIDKAAEIGCSGVKFQLFRIDQLFAPEALNHPKYREMLHTRRKWEMPLDWLPVLKHRCIERGIRFGVTPFYVGAVEELLPFVDFYKIASYSLLDRNLIRAIAQTSKPVIVSTGMATIEEIKQAFWTLLKFGKDQPITILHCVSTYPTPSDQVNSKFLLWLYDAFANNAVSFGWSDHSVDPAVIYYFAVNEGGNCEIVEFHLDLDEQGWEYNIGHCWLPEQVKPVIETVRRIEKITWTDNDKPYREVSESEQQERLWRADPSDGLRPVMEERGRLRDE